MGVSGFDLATLEKIERQLGGRIRDIITLFLDHTPERLGRVRQGASSGDLGESAEALHSIKSSAAMLGADELGRVAESLERAARENRGDDLASGMPELERAAREAETFLRRRIDGDRS